MPFSKPFGRALRRFFKSEGGNVSLEMVIWLPLIIGVLGATYSLFEAYRQQSLNVKAAYTISDALSRQTDPVDETYLDGMLSVLRFMTESDSQYGLRVSLVRYDADSGGFDVDWSQTRGSWDALEDRDMSALADELPQLLNNERVIVVETVTSHDPMIDIPVLQPETFYNFVFTRPRFAPQIVWAN